MPRKPSRSRRLATASLWPFGIGLTSWHYMWRTTPFHRRERPGSLAEDCPPDLPPDVSHDEVQLPEQGAGPLFHRRYQARISDSRYTPEDLFEQVSTELDAVAPTEFARFHKVRGEDGTLRPGDELVVRMPGPWDGPVRVVAVTPTSFRLVTLEGHLEAGQIEFRVAGASNKELVFTHRVLGPQRGPPLELHVPGRPHGQGGPAPHVDLLPGAGVGGGRRPADGGHRH
ncbi:MAG: DUF1990 family protein [Acidimicrobiales bacterium]